ncbi:hypothetical protein JJV70_00855 [Streptomyces sp. JJ66]|uniref:hypothetical protein n=1 Tax=Streptomyces sp. JJ66 TaxID=2803843 RepID=UPI001C590CBD|nr:hypothetical protein [Streptomyces sp. JJ66]MBW1600678.1 hypothetical protein [Streptomyces sp. JJ66]
MNGRAGPEGEGALCEFCQGTGSTTRAWAYVSGPDPFHGPAETILRSGQCRHCRGTGVYDSTLDPTLNDYRPRE